jgi:hypothetical protein
MPISSMAFFAAATMPGWFAKIQHALAVHDQPGALRRADGADAVVQSLRLQAFDLLLDPIGF